jgi:hypothetical protein
MKKEISVGESEELLQILKTRFEKNMHRHKGLVWENVLENLKSNKEKMWSLYKMESTGGEPDVVKYDASTHEFVFFDCSEESPAGRRSFCYDHQALESRKANKPENSAIQMAEEMGVALLSEEQYRELQQLSNATGKEFDTKTSSWVKTPEAIRKLGGALFCDRRFNQVFLYHNGAESYYAARGFRTFLRV